MSKLESERLTRRKTLAALVGAGLAAMHGDSTAAPATKQTMKIGCLRVLKQHGYTGVLSLETEGEIVPDQGQKLIETSRAYLIEALAGI